MTTPDLLPCREDDALAWKLQFRKLMDKYHLPSDVPESEWERLRESARTTPPAGEQKPENLPDETGAFGGASSADLFEMLGKPRDEAERMEREVEAICRRADMQVVAPVAEQSALAKVKAALSEDEAVQMMCEAYTNAMLSDETPVQSAWAAGMRAAYRALLPSLAQPEPVEDHREELANLRYLHDAYLDKIAELQEENEKLKAPMTAFERGKLVDEIALALVKADDAPMSKKHTIMDAYRISAEAALAAVERRKGE